MPPYIHQIFNTIGGDFKIVETPLFFIKSERLSDSFEYTKTNELNKGKA
jgi:hypothetical protein